MSFLKSRSGASSPVGCPDVAALAPDGYTNPIKVDLYTGALFIGADWIAPTLLNTWANYGSGYSIAGYRKIGDIIYVRGTITRSGTPAGTSMFVLPAGYFPPYTYQFVTPNQAGFAYVDVTPAGAIVPQSGVSGSFDINFQFSLAP